MSYIIALDLQKEYSFGAWTGRYLANEGDWANVTINTSGEQNGSWAYLSLSGDGISQADFSFGGSSNYGQVQTIDGSMYGS